MWGCFYEHVFLEFVQILAAWVESLGPWEPQGCTHHDVPKFQTSARPEGKETLHSKMHSHLQRSMQVVGSQVLVGSLAGQLAVIDSCCSNLELEDVDIKVPCEEILVEAAEEEDNEISDRVVVDELHLWPLHHLVIVGGPTGLHFFKQEGADLRRLGGTDVPQQGANTHLSTFGAHLAFQLDKPNTDISLATALVEDNFVNLNLGMEFDLEGRAVMWKLWESRLIVVLRSGEIAVYSIEGDQILLAKTDPNMLVMYQSPCFIFRWSPRHIRTLF